VFSLKKWFENFEKESWMFLELKKQNLYRASAFVAP